MLRLPRWMFIFMLKSKHYRSSLVCASARALGALFSRKRNSLSSLLLLFFRIRYFLMFHFAQRIEVMCVCAYQFKIYALFSAKQNKFLTLSVHWMSPANALTTCWKAHHKFFVENCRHSLLCYLHVYACEREIRNSMVFLRLGSQHTA